ncbi:MAG: hypothetical protein D6739_08220 [Nitrospirae bacterium]|nr:MAG: hypothetical protein D6739_08220 [Nitrospirota bacterium]
MALDYLRGGSSLAFIGPAGATRPPAPEEQGPAAEPNPPAQGGRSVTVNGDVSGSIIVTGDGNVIATPPGSPTPPAAADREGLERALAMARRALAILEEQAAGFTALTIPAHLKIELEEKRREVAELERRLQG